MGERARRVGLNEALFRTVNDGVELRMEEYERVRSEPTFFFVKPRHDAPDVESVVERHEDYWVVRKHEGEPAEIARRTDELT